MAVYIVLIKEYEDNDRVVYKYGPNETTMGQIGYDKKNKEILDIDSVDDENISNNFFFKRAARRLAVLSVKDEPFPDRTSIES